MAIRDENVYVEYRDHHRGAAFRAWRAFDKINPTVQEERIEYRKKKNKPNKPVQKRQDERR